MQFTKVLFHHRANQSLPDASARESERGPHAGAAIHGRQLPWCANNYPQALLETDLSGA